MPGIEHDAMSFGRLKQVLNETDGSLGTHLRKLEDGGYLAIEKTFRDRRPATWYEVTDTGRSSLRQRVDNLAHCSSAWDRDVLALTTTGLPPG